MSWLQIKPHSSTLTTWAQMYWGWVLGGARGLQKNTDGVTHWPLGNLNGIVIFFKWIFGDWWLKYLSWNCHQMNVTGPYWWSVNTGLANGLVLSGSKPLPEPMLTLFHDHMIQKVKSFCEQLALEHLSNTWMRNEVLFNVLAADALDNIGQNYEVTRYTGGNFMFLYRFVRRRRRCRPQILIHAITF